MKQDIKNIIIRKFDEMGDSVKVPLIRGNGTFNAKLSSDGIHVDNLGNQPSLPWNVFIEAVSIIKAKGGVAKKGDAMNSKLGETGLPLDSVEGYIAHKVYGKEKGKYIFRRITPIACILIWAKICKHKPGRLILLDNSSDILTDDIECDSKKIHFKKDIPLSEILNSGEMETYNCLKDEFSGEAKITEIAAKLKIGVTLVSNRLKTLESKGLVIEKNDKWQISSLSKTANSNETEVYNCLKDECSGEAEITEIAAKLNIGATLISNRLKTLESKGLVKKRKYKWQIVK